MDNDNEADDTLSTAELENMRLALQIALEREESDDEYSDDSEGEEYKNRKDYDESSSDEELSTGDDESTDSNEEEEEGCPVKRTKLDDAQSHEHNSERPVESEISGDNKAADLKMRKKRIPEFESDLLALPLPNGWIQTLHDSGVPIYLHQETHVVTLSRPYYLKTDSLRRHSIPLGSIPCQEQRILRERSGTRGITSQGSNNELQVPQVQIRMKEERISPDDLYEIVKDPFGVKEIMVVLGSGKENWKAIREIKKKERKEQAIKEDSLIDFDAEILPIRIPQGKNNIRKRGRLLNIIGKTSIGLLHEYSQKVLRGMIEFKVEHLNSTINPFSAFVFLKKTREGGEDVNLIGRASADSKKNAKRNAASEALRSLIPGIRIDENHIVQGNVSKQESMEVFDMLSIDDKNVSDYSWKIGRRSPYHILLKCVIMNSGSLGVTEPEETFEQKNGQNREVMIKVGKHETRVKCKSRRDGRDMASQILLKEMHPTLDTWGSVFRLYSNSDTDLETTRVRDKVCKNTHEFAEMHKMKDYTRNDSVLEALRKEMKRVNSCMEVRVEREKGLKTTRPTVNENDVNMERKEGNISILSTVVDL